MTTCNLCGREYEFSRKSGHGKTRCNSCVVNERRFAVKAKAIAYKGGKCQVCGYDKSSRALVFHHLDPSQKEGQMGGNHARKWEWAQRELDKCILLCSNCHAEEHERLDTETRAGRLMAKARDL